MSQEQKMNVPYGLFNKQNLKKLLFTVNVILKNEFSKTGFKNTLFT